MTKTEYKKWYDKTHKSDFKYWIGKQYRRMKRDEKNKFSSELQFTKEQFQEWILINYREKLNYYLKIIKIIIMTKICVLQ